MYYDHWLVMDIPRAPNQLLPVKYQLQVCQLPGQAPRFRLLLHLRPNYIHSASNDIHTDGPRATARARG